MSTITLKAHFDGKQICLDEPFELQRDSKLMITVLPESEETFDQERAAWLAFSQQSLARAYGEDEPDYSHCIGRMPPSE